MKKYEEVTITLYFANASGDQLIKVNRTMRYNTNISLEKLVVEQLVYGPLANKGKEDIPVFSTLNPGTKIINVSIKDGICYVNFDSTFLNESYNQKPEITIYSIVNSIVTNGNVTKVQILVDGSSDVKFMGTFDLSEPLEWKADLVED